MPDGAPDLNQLWMFAAVADGGGFTAAAGRLGVAKAKVSLAVARLEASLGQPLFARTTRRVSLTEAGQVLYEQSVPALRNLQDALEQAANPRQLTGTLRIGAATDYAADPLSPALAAFAASHPQLQIDLRTTDRVVDMLKEGLDLSLRLGWLRDSSQRARRLGTFEQYVVASPAYLKRVGMPSQPADLAALDWVALTLLQSPLTWKFTSPRGQVRTVRVNARLRTDAVGSLRSLLVQGAGVSVMDHLTAAQALRRGELVRVLPQWSLPRGGVHAVFAPGRHQPAKVRAFVDFYEAWLARAA